MVRPNYALGFALHKKDFKNGTVIKKKHKEFTEYWIYKQKESNLVGIDGNPLLLQDKSNSYLYCIIVCESNHIMSQTNEVIKVAGVRFTEEDINVYLRKTGRHVD